MKSSSSSGQIISDPLKQKQQISLLKEMHRPLEEHWNHCKPSSKGDKLDPIASDKLFKHHIARLQDIYVNRKFTVEKPFQVITVTPMTHLYGPRGLETYASPDVLQRRKESKESGWVSNFQISEEEKSPKRPTSSYSVSKSPSRSTGSRNRSRSRSSSPISHSNGNFNLEKSSSGENRTGAEESQSQQQPPPLPPQQQQQYDLNQRHKCVDPAVSQEQLLMLGMYHLTPEQEEVYQQFVAMLSSFETIDMIKIAEDAIKDARQDDFLHSFGGTAESEKKT